MRIVTGTISHETNVLSNILTNLEMFRRRRLFYGEEAYDYLYPLVDSFTGGAQNPQIDDDIAGHVDLTRP